VPFGPDGTTLPVDRFPRSTLTSRWPSTATQRSSPSEAAPTTSCKWLVAKLVTGSMRYSVPSPKFWVQTCPEAVIRPRGYWPLVSGGLVVHMGPYRGRANRLLVQTPSA
jgi:hypothetical protein